MPLLAASAGDEAMCDDRAERGEVGKVAGQHAHEGQAGAGKNVLNIGVSQQRAVQR